MRAGSIQFLLNKKAVAHYIIVSDQPRKVVSTPKTILHLSMKVCAWVRGGWEGGFVRGDGTVGQ
jgi:hypothetical protein